jgi:uncharacterized hydrophobic protein (TIGR00271 family)
MPSDSLDLDSILRFNPDYLPEFEHKLFIEGPLSGRRLVNFFALLLFAAIIATYGVLSDSSAAVIGAMLVAPLMTPVIATSAGVMMGSVPRSLRALGLTAAGVVTVILVSYLLTWIVPEMTISFSNNSEISSRTDPGLYALVIALGAGAAGAYITSRDELSDSLAGAAIALSLAPPLCVVGISLQVGQWDAASGAFLLFLTNYLATLFAGSLVLLVLGLQKQGAVPRQSRIRKVGFSVFLVGTLVVAIPLAYTAYTGLISLGDQSKATLEVQSWLDGTSYVVESVEVNDSLVIATVDGSGDLPPPQELADQLAIALKRPVFVDLRIIQALMSNSSSP